MLQALTAFSEDTPNAMQTNDKPARPRLLIIEDDPSLQTILGYYLSQRFDVEQVLGVDDALEAASQQHFDMFLVDIRLGEQRSGIDLLGLLRQMPAYRKTPAVVCSAYVDRANEQDFIREGFNACVAKPFKSKYLQDVIKAVLDGTNASAGQQPEA